VRWGWRCSGTGGTLCAGGRKENGVVPGKGMELRGMLSPVGNGEGSDGSGSGSSSSDGKRPRLLVDDVDVE
jgi:hypothetical protein